MNIIQSSDFIFPRTGIIIDGQMINSENQRQAMRLDGLRYKELFDTLVAQDLQYCYFRGFDFGEKRSLAGWSFCGADMTESEGDFTGGFFDDDTIGVTSYWRQKMIYRPSRQGRMSGQVPIATGWTWKS